MQKKVEKNTHTQKKRHEKVGFCCLFVISLFRNFEATKWKYEYTINFMCRIFALLSYFRFIASKIRTSENTKRRQSKVQLCLLFVFSHFEATFRLSATMMKLHSTKYLTANKVFICTWDNTCSIILRTFFCNFNQTYPYVSIKMLLKACKWAKVNLEKN
jgi:hypothetical protein